MYVVVKTKIKFFFLPYGCLSLSFLSLSSIIYLFFFQFVCMSMCAQCRSSITFAIWDGDDRWWKFEDVINFETQQQVSLTFSSKCNNETHIVLFINDKHVLTSIYYDRKYKYYFISFTFKNWTILSKNLFIYGFFLYFIIHNAYSTMIGGWILQEAWFIPIGLFFFLISSLYSLISIRVHIVLYKYKKSDIHSPTRSLARAHFFYCIKMQICKRKRVREREREREKKAELVLCANFSLSVKREYFVGRKIFLSCTFFFSSSHLLFINQTDFDLFE
jgi:hypothetical protein